MDCVAPQRKRRSKRKQRKIGRFRISRRQGAPLPGLNVSPAPAPVLDLVADLCSGAVFRTLSYCGVFDLHIAKFFGIENFATLEALDEFFVFVPGNYAYSGVFTGACHRYYFSDETILFRPDCSELCADFKRLFLSPPPHREPRFTTPNTTANSSPCNPDPIGPILNTD